jgi:hypothetical protein
MSVGSPGLREHMCGKSMLITESFTKDRAIKYLVPLVMEFVIFICWRPQRGAGAHFLLFKRRTESAEAERAKSRTCRLMVL